ncbi:carbohydrate kinase [Pseudorhodoferax sp. Leaf274]|uniref:carbohydrate kinase family protein n=1 Tax=Pseudorhodoferax sp. Leaf274 TaxID=1736318 RepID=UPI000703BE2E|nr:carbohydrate kinase [Pseudorhodoferax sp. Leaf274]KQP35650.1 ribokinase [Pseudorhodoferax sp. Leaf274]
MSFRVAFVGEALIDFTAVPDAGLQFQGHVGGALLNGAVAAARLGVPVGYLTQLSTDMFGERLLAHLQANGIATDLVLRSPAPSTLAFVERLPQTNRYAFYMQATADVLWAPDPLPALPGDCRWLHYGSNLLTREPSGQRVLDFARAQRGRVLRVFDPNARPSLVDDLAAWRARCAECIAACELLKLSDEDCALLAPGQPFDDLAQAWLQAGPLAVLLTRGAQGATLYRPGHAPLAVRPPPVQVVDTIGAGDTFGAGLSAALLDQGVEDAATLAALPTAAWAAVLRFAATAAALNCAREGADPPQRAAVEALQAQAAAG